ncbi:MAG: hypothetical protein ACK443_11020 [Methylococcaceae bacterium]|jgi:tetratricopeptide (TPR) repeat protein
MTRALFKVLRIQVRGWLGLSQPMAGKPPQVHSTTPEMDKAMQAQAGHVPYDENLLERARLQWQLGDWESLSQLDRNTLQHHPDRAKLALLAAAGRLQIGYAHAAQHYIRLAISWGCSEKLVKQILVAGVYNTLGRATTVMGKEQKALQHFSQAITLGIPGAEGKRLIQGRIEEQTRQLQREDRPRPNQPGTFTTTGPDDDRPAGGDV